MASSDPAKSFTYPRYANSDPPDKNSDELSGSIRITFDKTFLLCDPCLEDGQNLPAEGYCVDCSHYLCLDCYKHHLKPLVWRHHQILNKQQMPKTKPPPVYKDECTDECQEHSNETIKFYCKECKQFGCSVCVTLEHYSCNQRRQVGYIPNLSKDFLQSKEYTSFKTSMNYIANQAATVLGESKKNIKAANSQADQALAEIRKLRKEINSYFDELEKELVEKVENSRIAYKKKLEKISRECGVLSMDIGKLQLDVTDKEIKDQKCRLFVDTKHSLQKLREYDDKMRKLVSENKVGDLDFIPSSMLSRLAQDKTLTLGFFIRQDKQITIKPSNERCSEVTGISLLSNNKVALIDYQMNRIHVVDRENNSTVTSESQGFVWGITKVSDSEVAVIQGENIAIYSVTNGIKLKKTIRTTGLDNRTLVYTKSRFIVVTNTEPLTLRMVDMNGRVVRTFPTEEDGKVLFNDPRYMAVNANHTRIYVSDCGMRAVTCLTFDGKVRARYKPEERWLPSGVTVARDGRVYVADSYHSIHILSSGLHEICVISGSSYGIKDPEAIAYCDRDHKLYVGMFNNNQVTVLNI